jgi:hypothetical protein
LWWVALANNDSNPDAVCYAKSTPHSLTQVGHETLDSVPEMVVLALFPWCFTPELYAAKPDYIQSLAAFVRSRPAQSVASFMQQSNAVIAHDAEAQLVKITAPTQITGDPYLRTLLVQGAQHILGPFGADSDLRRWGLKLAERGGRNGRSEPSLPRHAS